MGPLNPIPQLQKKQQKKQQRKSNSPTWCKNSSLTDKLKLLVIGFKNKANLPTEYKASKKNWMNGVAFKEWLNSTNKGMKKKKKKFSWSQTTTTEHMVKF